MTSVRDSSGLSKIAADRSLHRRSKVAKACSCFLANDNYFRAMTETLSIKVSKELKARLRAAAKSRNTKPSALVREALELVVSGTAPNIRLSLYDLSKDLFENLVPGGPRDLSTNREYLDDLGQ